MTNTSWLDHLIHLSSLWSDLRTLSSKPMGRANLSNSFASSGHPRTTSLQLFCGPWATRPAASSNQVDRQLRNVDQYTLFPHQRGSARDPSCPKIKLAFLNFLWDARLPSSRRWPGNCRSPIHLVREADHALLFCALRGSARASHGLGVRRFGAGAIHQIFRYFEHAEVTCMSYEAFSGHMCDFVRCYRSRI